MPILAVDTEGTLTHPFSETWGLSWYAGGQSEYYPFNHLIGQNLPVEWLRQIQTTLLDHPCLLFHNAKHDLKSLRNLGIDYQGKFYDTMLIAHMVDENIFSKELDFLSKKFLGRSKEKSKAMEDIIKALGWSYIPAEIMRHYGAVDAELTAQLFNYLYRDFTDAGYDDGYWDIEQDFIRLVLDMENTGVLVDQSVAEQELARGLAIMKELEKQLGFNPASTTQLGKFLLEDLGLQPFNKRTPKGKPTFNKDAMVYYEHLLSASGNKSAQMVLAYRGWQKTTSSNYKAYLELISKDGRLRPNFKIHGTKTGRMSCEKPNLQQIPRSSENDWNGKLKKAFIQDPEFNSWEFDFAQLEFRMGASYAQETKLIEVFNDPSRDIFSEMAADLGMPRQPVKTTVYLTQYGGGSSKLADTLGIDIITAGKIIRNFYDTYPGLAKIAKYANTVAKNRGYVKYWTGRRRHFPGGMDAHKAWNSMIQGGSFEVVKRQSLALKEAGLINEECQLNLQVHDSLRFDILRGKEEEYIPAILEVMETPTLPEHFDIKFKVEATEWGTKNTWDRESNRKMVA